jgi:hypothetical protein
MGFFWREWNRGQTTGVSGWDGGVRCVLMLIATVIGVVVLVALGQQWGWLGTVGVVAILSLRYQLVISKDGYRLCRTCCLLPWQVRRFSKRAFLYVEPEWCNDDWSDGPGRLCMGEPSGLNYEQCAATADFGEPMKTVFGNVFDSEMVAYRIRVLAFQVGCTQEPPEDPFIAKPVVPNLSRRARWRKRWKKKNEIN